MEDRYLFKAKSLKNGKWENGYFVKNQLWAYIVKPLKNGQFDVITVNPNTVCQCTGLKEKNDKLIWENDIVKFDIYYYEKLESSTISQIKWCNSLCALSLVVNDKGTRGTLGHLMDLNKEIEVIGNIFDNPELLESEG